MGFWSKLHKSKLRQTIFCMTSMVVLLTVYTLSMFFGQTYKTNERLQSERIYEDINIVTCVETIEETKKSIEIAGWALRRDSTVKDSYVVLQPTNGTEAKVLNTEINSRTDIESFIEASWNVGECGFVAEIKKDDLVQNVCYEILVAVDYESSVGDVVQKTRKKVSTKKYIYNSELYDYIPSEYVKPVIQDETIRTVLEQGKVCGYDIDKQIWVYQYKEKAYVIVGNDIYKEWEGNLEVPFHLWTSQNDKLPENRKQHGFDNKDFIFHNKEISVSSEDYRVAVIDIPQEYLIINARIGIFDSKKNEWIWRVDFSPEIN